MSVIHPRPRNFQKILVYTNVFYCILYSRTQSIARIAMSKTVTLRLKEEVYQRLKRLAKNDNRPLSNYIETAALRFADDNEYADEFEMQEILENGSLNQSIKKGQRDARAKRCQFV